MRRNSTKEFFVGKHHLYALISPCSWEESGTGDIQIEVSYSKKDPKEQEKYYLEVRTSWKEFSKDLDSNLEKVLATIKTCKCPDCGGLAIKTKFAHPVTPIFCKACAEVEVSTHKKELQRLREAIHKMDKELLQAEKQKFKEGYRWRVEAVIHRQSGDDKTGLFFFKVKPTKDQVEKAFRIKASQKLDYRISPLTI